MVYVARDFISHAPLLPRRPLQLQAGGQRSFSIWNFIRASDVRFGGPSHGMVSRATLPGLFPAQAGRMAGMETADLRFIFRLLRKSSELIDAQRTSKYDRELVERTR